MDFYYKIASATDRSGNDKNLYDWFNHVYWIKNMGIGTHAYLIPQKSEKALITTKVEDMRIWDGGIVFTTANTIYYLENAELKG